MSWKINSLHCCSAKALTRAFLPLINLSVNQQLTKIYFKKCFKEESNYLHFGYKEEEHLSCLVLVFIFFKLPIHEISFYNVDFFFFYSFLSFWLSWVFICSMRISLVAACRLFGCCTQALLPCSMWDLSSLTKDQTHVPQHWKADS